MLKPSSPDRCSTRLARMLKPSSPDAQQDSHNKAAPSSPDSNHAKQLPATTEARLAIKYALRVRNSKGKTEASKDGATKPTSLIDILAENLRRARNDAWIVSCTTENDASDDERDGGEYDANRWLVDIHNVEDDEDCEANEEEGSETDEDGEKEDEEEDGDQDGEEEDGQQEEEVDKEHVDEEDEEEEEDDEEEEVQAGNTDAGEKETPAERKVQEWLDRVKQLALKPTTQHDNTPTSVLDTLVVTPTTTDTGTPKDDSDSEDGVNNMKQLRREAYAAQEEVALLRQQLEEEKARICIARMVGEIVGAAAERAQFAEVERKRAEQEMRRAQQDEEAKRKRQQEAGRKKIERQLAAEEAEREASSIRLADKVDRDEVEGVIRVASWNLKKLNTRHPQKLENIAAVILDSAFDLVVLQEVSSTKDGEMALLELTTKLNQIDHQPSSSKGTPWRMCMSEPAGNNERYAVLWRTDSSLGAENPQVALVKRLDLDAKEWKKSRWTACSSSVKSLSWSVRRRASSDRWCRSSEAETAILQALATTSPVRPILLGDANMSETSTFEHWNPRRRDESSAFEAVRSSFCNAFKPALSFYKACTNLYPIAETPASNDNIWLPAGRALVDAGVASLPASVVEDLRSRSLSWVNERSLRTKTFTHASTELFSDHCAIYADLALQPGGEMPNVGAREHAAALPDTAQDA
ncbi:hypothetical protein NFJ02_45g113270 [Pycnococcus provasolii]